MPTAPGIGKASCSCQLLRRLDKILIFRPRGRYACSGVYCGAARKSRERNGFGSHRHLGLAVQALAKSVLPGAPTPDARARVCGSALPLGRAERLLLLAAAPG